ncbi:Acyl dehydratase [Blastococcus aurantiacus]|uniref:Acyl dehydratase n=1 Tax=Blastococcus aurantiacus TaxID=1550231 RepID=A0A1G7HIT6_9ACTN|nr:MaoC family dehydratase [Blastococcus aurantiacus]SDF00184.1 Acyl dehydratase [Blastococcus aurantiacus]
MPLDPSAIGREGPVHERSWTSKDALLYAVGVGAGLGDPSQELSFTTENSHGVEQQVLPTFGVLLAQARGVSIGEFNPAMLVHAEQEIRLHRVLPVEGTLRAQARVESMEGKRSGALVTSSSTATDADGTPLITTRSSIFIRGEQVESGAPATADDWAQPDREPDWEVTLATRPEQALLYRLNGDRNPLHSDPAFAARAGFERPILHGLCTYGITGRALLQSAMGGDPGQFRAMSGRFSSPVLPGDELTVRIWRHEGGADGAVLFQTLRGDGTVVIDRGRAEVGAPE